MNRSFLFLLLCCCLLFTAVGAQAIEDPGWQEVHKAINNGLPKTAIEKLEPIIQNALKANKLGEAARAMTKKITLEANIQGNKAEEKITRLETEIPKADPKIQPLLKTILARWYWHFFQQNSWRFLNRSATAALNDKDFTTWDLPRLFSHIGGTFQEALKAEKQLKAIQVTELEDFLERGNQPTVLRPTLYDFIAHQALEFYMWGENTTAKPQDSFEMTAESPAFAEAKAFMAWNPTTTDTDSANLQALQLFQKLLSFHVEKSNLDAQLDTDLARFRWARNFSVGEGLREAYIKALQGFAEKYSDHAHSAFARAAWAQELIAAGKRVEAHAIATEGLKRFRGTGGGNDCQAIIYQIEAKTLDVKSERVVNLPSNEIRISYTNITKVHFRLIPRDWKKMLASEGHPPENLNWEEQKKLTRVRPAHEWSVELPPTPDYQVKTHVAAFPKAEPGLYYLLASWKADFVEDGNALRHSPVWVSSLALLGFSRNSKVGGMVLDNDSGAPLPGAQVEAYEYVYKGWLKKGYYWEELNSTATDKNGQFSFGIADKSVLTVAHYKGEVLFSADMQYPSRTYPTPTTSQVFFFTDRSLYRPGQTIQFKGLVVRSDQESNRYDIVPNHGFSISFRDSNHKEVQNIKVTSNEFGSFSGTFTAPSGRLTGAMTILSQGPTGQTTIRVEEYKRPKFQVQIDPPKESFKLNDSVTLKGKALAYTGAAIDGAQVKFRVVRNVQMPWWWCWGPVQNESREIVHGNVTTDKDGSFTITFQAVPDLAVPEKNQPVFSYVVSADVTDSSGETRSQSQTVRVGYVAMNLQVSHAEWLTEEKPIQFRFNTATLDGQPLSETGSFLIYSLKNPAQPKKPAIDAGNPDLRLLLADWESGPVAAEGTFQTDASGGAESTATLKPGAFRLVAKSKDRFGKEIEVRKDFLVLAPNAKTYDIRIPHFFRSQSISVEPGQTYVGLWGTGYDKGRAWVEVEHRNKLLQAYWTPADTTQHRLEIPVTEEMRGGFNVRLFYVRENRLYQESAFVQVPWTNKQFKLAFEHFTSKLRPGQEENWSIRIQGPGAEMKAVEMAATLYDASLDAFYPHSWSALNIFRQSSSYLSLYFTNRRTQLQHMANNWNPSYGFQDRQYHRFPHDIMQNFHSYGFSRNKSLAFDSDALEEGSMEKRSRGAPMAAPAPMMSKAKMDSSDKEMNAVSGLAASMPTGDSTPQETPAQTPAPGAGNVDLSKVAARKNLNETAFFFPHLRVESDGAVKLTFTMPEALTTWKFMGFAHGKACESGILNGETVTQKELMVQPLPPRFLREGDRLVFTSKVTNLSEQPQKGKIKLALLDSATEKSRDADFGNSGGEQSFDIPAKESRSFNWTLTVPDGAGMLTYKVVAATDQYSDGEEGMFPILSRRILVHESLPLWINDQGEKKFSFQKLIDSASSATLKHLNFTVQMTSNPAWYAVQALPYLMEFPHECNEQTFNRFYANSLARHIATSDPKIQRVFETWKAAESQGGKALKSNLEKNEDLKNVLLVETPWVCQAENETEAKHRVGLLFDKNRVNSELERALQKLTDSQFPDGSWSWFPGGYPDAFITLYITTGFGRLRHLGVKTDMSPAIKALHHLDAWIDKQYREILRHGHPELNHLSSTVAMYLYGRSFFLKERPIPGDAREAVDYFMKQGKKYWLDLSSRLSQGHLALGMQRMGDKETAQKIFASIKERSVTQEELGRFWRETELSWWWYRAPIETQAIMIELFDEVGKDPKGMEECKIWLLKQKQTQDWKTSKATADAVYALLLKGADLLASDKLVKVLLGSQEVKPENVEAGTGFYEKRYPAADVKPEMGNITLIKEDKGIAWGGVHWQYLEDMSKVTPASTTLSLKKTLFIKKDTAKGPQLFPYSGKLNVGDLLTMRIELRVDRDMEYVHMKDGRGSGLEPVNVLSGYKYQDGLRYYQSTKDTASHFFIDYLPKGTYVFEYNLRVQHKGAYQTGMAEIQCMYAPEFSSHSESFLLNVE